MKVRLEGVNALLRAIGEIPLVSEADFDLSEEARQAETQIEATLVSVLSKGFKFNRFDTKLLPDISGYIAVPENALVLEFSDDNLSINNGVVFDRSTYTTIFEDAVDVKITYYEQFDFVPIVIQEYIIAEASVIFQRDTVNDANKNAELEKTRNEAKRELNIYKIRQAKGNAKDSRFSRTSNPVN